jgi:rubrerythrin
MHEERYRKLLLNVEMQEVFKKSTVQVWECRNCVTLSSAPRLPLYAPFASIRRLTLKSARKTTD